MRMQLVCQRFLACARCKLWWMTPEWGSRALHIPPETQFALFQTAAGGPYIIALPLIDNQTYRGTLRGPKRWALCLLLSILASVTYWGSRGWKHGHSQKQAPHRAYRYMCSSAGTAGQQGNGHCSEDRVQASARDDNQWGAS